MAVDWNQEVSLSTITNLFKRNSKKAGTSSYPTKTTMNLYQSAEHTANLFSVAITAVLLIVFISLFVKFGVLDQLSALSHKQGELARQEAVVAKARQASADYDSVKDAYDAFTLRYGQGSEDAMAVLDMVEQRVMSKAKVASIVLADDTLTLVLNDVPLKTAGDLAKDLEEQPMVSSVNISTATTENAEAQSTISTLIINLYNAQAEEG